MNTGLHNAAYGDELLVIQELRSVPNKVKGRVVVTRTSHGGYGDMLLIDNIEGAKPCEGYPVEKATGRPAFGGTAGAGLIYCALDSEMATETVRIRGLYDAKRRLQKRLRGAKNVRDYVAGLVEVAGALWDEWGFEKEAE